MKTFLSLFSAFILVGTMVSCGGQNNSSSQITPEPAPPKNYTEIIINSRDDESNKYFPIIGKDADGKSVFTHNPFEVEDIAVDPVMTLEVMGIKKEDITDYAISTSLINIKVNSVAIIVPAEGKTDAVVEGLNGYVKSQQKSFEQYLQDQYQIALNAKVEVMESGEVVITMCENSDEIFTSIKEALK